MRVAITGTYSSGKTFTALAVAHHLGLPRTQAMTMREILPFAAPGKTLEQCTGPELIQMIIERHGDRIRHETLLGDTFVSDGCSLQEWIYGAIRVLVGINPNASAGSDEDVALTPELRFFADVMDQIGHVVTRHVARGFDLVVHLENELPLAADGHRPVNDRFRTLSDERLREVLATLGVPVHVVRGSVEQRLAAIADVLRLEPVIPAANAVERAAADYARIDVRDERARAGTRAA